MQGIDDLQLTTARKKDQAKQYGIVLLADRDGQRKEERAGLRETA
jgi:hypothetical protein